MLFFAHQSQSIELYWELFKTHSEKEFYEFFEEIRKAALQMQNLNKATFVDISLVYLNTQE